MVLAFGILSSIQSLWTALEKVVQFPSPPLPSRVQTCSTQIQRAPESFSRLLADPTMRRYRAALVDAIHDALASAERDTRNARFVSQGHEHGVLTWLNFSFCKPFSGIPRFRKLLDLLVSW